MSFTWTPQLEGLFRRYKLSCEGRFVLGFNHAPPEESYWLRQRRPSLHPFVTPAGAPVTEQGGHTMPHHKAVWIGHGDIGGVNFYVDEPFGGHIRTTALTFRATAYVAAIDCRIEWAAPDGRVMLEETRRHRVRAGARANRVDVETVLTTPLDAVELKQEKHGFFHVRAAELLSEDLGGAVTASSGKTGCEAIYGSEGFWLDTRGTLAGRRVGVVIMGHRDDGPQPLFTRSYGTVALQPFLYKGETLAKGARWRRVYSVTAYDNADGFDVAEAYEAFCATVAFE